MKQNKKIAITGGIGSGKSLLGEILKGMGYEVISCDAIYAQMLQEEEYLALLKARFPDCFLGAMLDKKRLAERVFSNEENRKALESLAHPFIMQRLLAQMEGKGIVFAEVPLLFEGGYEGLFDYVIALVRSQEERVKAVMERSGLTQEEVLSRMQSQFDPARLSGKDCIIVENNGTKEELTLRAKEIINQLGY